MNTNQSNTNKGYESFYKIKGGPTNATFVKVGTDKVEAGKMVTLQQIGDPNGTVMEMNSSELMPVPEETRKAIIAKYGFSPNFRKLEDPHTGYLVGSWKTGTAVIMAITSDSVDLFSLDTKQRIKVGKSEVRMLPGASRDEVKQKNRLFLEKLEDVRRAEKQKIAEKKEERKHFRAFSGGVYESPYHGPNGNVNEEPLGLILVLSVFDGVKGANDRWANVRQIVKEGAGYKLSSGTTIAAVYLDEGTKTTQCMFPTDSTIVEEVKNLPEVKEVLAKLQTGRK